jgi:hypothetical protein
VLKIVALDTLVSFRMSGISLPVWRAPNAHITQKWQIIVNTAVTEKLRFLQQKLTLCILKI